MRVLKSLEVRIYHQSLIDTASLDGVFSLGLWAMKVVFVGPGSYCKKPLCFSSPDVSRLPLITAPLTWQRCAGSAGEKILSLSSERKEICPLFEEHHKQKA
jgi:hypothetical protein